MFAGIVIVVGVLVVVVAVVVVAIMIRTFLDVTILGFMVFAGFMGVSVGVVFAFLMFKTGASGPGSAPVSVCWAQSAVPKSAAAIVKINVFVISVSVSARSGMPPGRTRDALERRGVILVFG